MPIWLFNVMLYLAFVFDPSSYRAQVAAGAPCWVQADATYLPTMGLGDHSVIQPACWYDPSNSNGGYLLAPLRRHPEPGTSPRIGGSIRGR